MLWLKAFHIIFVVTWFAGLFYLPRLFVYHAMAADTVSRERFQLMERRLFGIMTIGGGLATLCGFALIGINPGLLEARWLQVKLMVVVGLVGYHLYCLRLIRDLRAGRDTRTPVWYRWYNEAPTLALIAAVTLAVVKPTLA